MRQKLSIVHVARSPVGGIFRHIADLASAQHAAGHAVGLICDSTSGGALRGGADRRARAEAGARRRAASDGALDRPGRPRRPLLAVSRRIARMRPDVVHAHGAKGGVFGRLAARHRAPPRPHASPPSTRRMAAACTTTRRSLSGRVYFAVERALERADRRADPRLRLRGGDLSRRKSACRAARRMSCCNGLRPEEFEPVAPRAGRRRLPLHRRAARPEGRRRLHRGAGDAAGRGRDRRAR